MATWPERHVHGCVTSPPYFGLRDYGVDGQIGLELTPDEFVACMVEVFRGVWRVLRDDAVLWLNLGDSYSSGGRANYGPLKEGDMQATNAAIKSSPRPAQPEGIKPKDLLGIPWSVAFALRADGWYLRSAMPWVKRGAMPESCTDRPTSALEYVFLLTKKPQYFWDADAVKVKAAQATHDRDKYSRILTNDGPQSVRHDHETVVSESGRNFRNTDLYFESLKKPHGMIFVGDEPVAGADGVT